MKALAALATVSAGLAFGFVRLMEYLANAFDSIEDGLIDLDLDEAEL